MNPVLEDISKDAEGIIYLKGQSQYIEFIDCLQQILSDAVHENEAVYIIVDITLVQNVQIVDMGLRFKLMMRTLPENARIQLAIVVDLSLAQALPHVWKTILRRDDIQFFANNDKALSWLKLRQGFSK